MYGRNFYSSKVSRSCFRTFYTVLTIFVNQCFPPTAHESWFLLCLIFTQRGVERLEWTQWWVERFWQSVTVLRNLLVFTFQFVNWLEHVWAFMGARRGVIWRSAIQMP